MEIEIAAFLLAVALAVHTVYNSISAKNQAKRQSEISDQHAAEIKRLHQQLSWAIGAMESHSDLILTMLASDREIPMFWWDPSEEGPLPSEASHGRPVKLEKIYCGLPAHLRKEPPTWTRD